MKKILRAAQPVTFGKLPALDVTLNTQTINAGVTLTHTTEPRRYDVTASIPDGQTVTIAETGTLVITGW